MTDTPQIYHIPNHMMNGLYAFFNECIQDEDGDTPQERTALSLAFAQITEFAELDTDDWYQLHPVTLQPYAVKRIREHIDYHIEFCTNDEPDEFYVAELNKIYDTAEAVSA